MTRQGKERQGQGRREANHLEDRPGGKHWLGEGLDGQESLFLEIDPFVYRADSTVCQLARSLYFELAPQRDRLSALLLPSSEGVGYQQGFLASMFQVYLSINEYDELREAAAEEFSCFLSVGPLTKNLEGELTLIIEGTEEFLDIEDFRARLRSARDFLAPEGKLLVVFHGFHENGQTDLRWGNGTRTPLLDLLSENVFLVPSPHQFIELPFDDLSEDYENEFLKRHRAYFGKAVKGALQQRLRDSDFSIETLGDNRARNRSIVCVWGSEELNELKLR